MRRGLLSAPIMGALILIGGWQQAVGANVLTNGDFEATWTSGATAPSWNSFNNGNGWSWAKDTTNYRGTAAQKISRTTTNTSNTGAVWQSVSANVGDAFTLGDAWVYCAADSTKTQATVRVRWDGVGTDFGNAPILATATQSANAWYEFTSHPGGNATGTTVRFAFLSRMAPGNAASTDLTTTWDDLVVYRAYVPPAPSVVDPTATTLTVDVNPGGNSDNALAQYSIRIGTNYVQADGSVGATPAWLTDAEWGSKVVTGLAASTTYDFEVVARYSSAFTQETLPQGYTFSLATTPEPATLGFLVLGAVAALRGRRW